MFFLRSPKFMFVLIDYSGSMEPYTQDVIEGHKEMLRVLRNSGDCKDGVLYIYQCLFYDTFTILNPIELLDPNGKDRVAALSEYNYRPSGSTSLYDAIMQTTKELKIQVQHASERGLKPTVSIVVITNGLDGTSKYNTDDVRAAMTELHDQEILASSVIVGLRSPDFREEMLQVLKK